MSRILACLLTMCLVALLVPGAGAADGLVVKSEGGTVTLTWPKVENAVWYNLYWRAANAAAATETKLVNVNSPLVLDRLPPGGTFAFRIAAGLADVEKDTGMTATATVAPAPPKFIDIQGAGVNATLTWDISTGAQRYRIYWNDHGSVSTSDKSIESAHTPFVHQNLNPGGKYYYRIAALNDGGESALSPEFSVQLTAGAPVIASATGAGNEVSIKWDPVPSADVYDLYWNTSGNVSVSDARIQFVTSVFIHTGLVRGGDYYYRLSARNAGGESELSPEVRVTVPPPDPVPKLHATSDSAELRWDPVFGADSYAVYWDTRAGVGEKSRRISSASSPFRADGLQPGQTYYYRVAAINRGGESLSPEVAVALRPAMPAITRAEKGVRQITLFANPVVGATGYHVYWNTRGNVNSTDQKIVDVSMPYTHVSLSAGATYFYRIAAVNVAGESVLSPEFRMTLPPDPPNVTGISGASKRVNLKWEESRGADTYAVYWNTTGKVTRNDRRLIVSGTAFEHGPLDNGSKYFYRIAGVNAGGEGDWSAETSVTLAPDAPVVSTTAQAQGVELKWPAVAGATAYHLYWNTTGNVTTKDKKIGHVTAPYTHDRLNKGDTYYYLLTASNEGGETGGVPVQVTLAPASPVALKATGSDSQVALNWSASNGATDYRVYWNITGKVSEKDAVFESKVGSIVHAARDNGATYYYRVAAVNAGGGSPLSDEASVTLAPNAPVVAAPEGGVRQSTLRWEPVSGATSYHLYWKNTAQADAPEQKIENVKTPYIHNQLTNGLTYTYVVAAANAGGQTRAAPVTVTLRPDAPTLEPALGADKQTTLRWSTPPGVTGYTLLWNTRGNVTAQDGRIDVAAAPYAHTALQNGGTYYYRVVARNAAGDGPPSNEVAVTLAPDAPGITRAVNGDREVQLEWTSMFGATGYRIYWNTTGQVSAQDKKLETKEPRFTHTALPRGVRYYYRVAAHNAGGETLSAEVPVTLAPDATFIVSARGLDQQVQLAWKGVTGAAEYRIHWNTTGNVTAQDAVLKTSATSIVHDKIANGGTYRYRVVAVNDGGASELSPEMAVTLAPDAPALIPGQSEDRQITLQWKPAPGAQRYTIYWKRVDAAGKPDEKVENAVSPQVFKGLTNSVKYSFTITASNEGGEGHTSERVTVAPHNRILFGLFPDPALQQCVNSEAAANGWTYADEINGILVCNGLGISNLGGLQWLENITNLSLRGNAIADLTPLQNLKTLNFLALDNNRIVDPGKLNGLEGLNYLSLSGNAITDLAPLASLTNLTSLFLNDTRVSDLGPLASLKALSTLAVNNADVVNLNPLSGLSKLARLYVSGNRIADVGALATLRELIELDVSRNEIGGKGVGNIGALLTLKNLNILHLYANPGVSCAEATTLLQKLGSPPVDLDGIAVNTDVASEGENCTAP